MIDINKIPAELKSYSDWTTWYYNLKDNGKKPEKCPNVPPSKWDKGNLYTFNGILREFDRCQLPDNKSHADGIGIVFHENNNLIGIDIDNISDNEAEADPIIKSLLTTGQAGYIERSVSGGGFHLIGKCSNKQVLIDLLKNHNGKSGARTAKIELYINKRFFTVSGNAICSNFGNIDIAALIALEYITNKPILCSIASIINNSSIATKPKPALYQCNINNTLTPALATPPPPNTFSDEEVLKLPLRPIKETINFMYKTKPILKNILEKDGFVLAPDYWKVYGRNNPKKDTSPSGFDQEIASVVIFWLYRYGVGKIIEILSESKLNRDKPLADYWTRTVSGAYERAIEFFPATYLGKLSWTEQQKLKNWQNWKKEMAKQER